jgi:hypothetical protein
MLKLISIILALSLSGCASVDVKNRGKFIIETENGTIVTNDPNNKKLQDEKFLVVIRKKVYLLFRF